MEKTQHLLNQVGALLKSYEKLARSTGENFNIFTVMGMESNEVKTHSAIIGELLNPKGSHGLGDKPLKLFIDLVVKPLYFQENETYGDFEKMFDFDFESTYSKVEDFAGRISEDGTEGGRIDIVIKDNSDQVFLIENKIYAGEQKNQLIRYNNYYRDAPIFFLTLFGKDAESAHDLEKNKDYFTISYEKDILSWLYECVKEAVKFPMLREVINQYINLIKKLTHQTMNNELKDDISKLIEMNLQEASEIFRNFESVYENFLNKVLVEIEKTLDEKLNRPEKNWKIEVKQIQNKGLNIVIRNDDWNNFYVTYRYKKTVPTFNVRIENKDTSLFEKLKKSSIVAKSDDVNCILWGQIQEQNLNFNKENIKNFSVEFIISLVQKCDVIYKNQILIS